MVALPAALSRVIEISFVSSQAGDFINTFIEVNKQIDGLKFSLDAISSNSFESESRFKVLTDVASNLGLQVGPLGKSYSNLLEAVKGTNLEGEPAERIFRGIAAAAATLGLDGVKAERALKAVEQIASKGKVSLEEVRGQLGDAIPGAVPIFAQAAGVTVDEFFKLVEQGNLSSDVLSAVADILINKFGDATTPVDTLTAAIGRIDTEIDLLLVALGETGIKDLIIDIFQGAADVIKDTRTTIEDFNTGIKSIKEIIEAENWDLLFELISDAAGGIIDDIPDFFKDFGPSSLIFDAIKGFAELIKDETVRQIISQIADGDFSGAARTIYDSITTLFEGISIPGSNILTAIGAFADSLSASFIGETVKKLGEGDFTGALTTFTDGLKAVISDWAPASGIFGFGLAAGQIISDLVDAFVDGDFSKAVAIIEDGLKSVLDTWGPGAALFSIASGTFISELTTAIGNGDWSKVSDLITTEIGNIFNSLPNSQIITDISTFATNLFDSLTSNIGDEADKITFDGAVVTVLDAFALSLKNTPLDVVATGAAVLGRKLLGVIDTGISSGTATGSSSAEDFIEPFKYLDNEFDGVDAQVALQNLQGDLERAKEKAKEFSDRVKDANDNFKALGSKERLEDLSKIETAFNNLATNPAVNSDDFFTVWNQNLRKFVDDPEGINILSGAISKAYGQGKITAEEATSAYGTLQLAQDGVLTKVFKLQDEFQKLDNKSKNTNGGLTDKGKKIDDLKDKAEKYQTRLQKLADDQKIKLIQATVSLKIAEAEANAKILTATLDGLRGTIESTGNVLSSIFSSGGAFASALQSDSDEAFDIVKDQIDKENKIRQEAFDLQKKLTESQIASINAKTALIQSGSALIQIDGAGLQPHLEGFMWEILKTIQLRVAADGLDLLLGT